MKRLLLFFVAALCIAGFCLTQYWIFYRAPLEQTLFFNQKIVYYHVPCAAMLFLSVILCGVASLVFLKTRRGGWDDLALAAGELSVLFGAIVLVTGSIWGKAAWGTWWTWDARLTTSLLLWMVMLGYVLVRKYGGPGSERLGAGLAVFGAVDVPLDYFSVKIWRTLHPKTSVVPSMKGDMLAAFLMSMGLFLLFYCLLLAARLGVARDVRRLHGCRERALDAGILE